MKKFFVSLLFITFAFSLCAQGLFISEKGSKFVLGKRIGIPYQQTVNVFGYIAEGQKPDAIENGKKMYYFYIWVPAVVPEIGVRMMSPIPDSKSPQNDDFCLPGYSADVERNNYFDTWVRLDRAGLITSIDDAINKVKNTTWIPYGSDDDSSELPANPGGQNYNSVLRVETELGSLPLVVGIYRVAFTTYKSGEDIVGSFWAQIGTTLKLPGVMIARTVPELVDKVKAYQATH